MDSSWWVRSVTVETSAGRSASGETFLTAKAVACYYEDAQDVTVGSSILAVSDGTVIFAPISQAPDSPPIAGQFAVNSKVTVDGQVTRVVSVKRQVGSGLGVDLDHVEVLVK